jgi:ferredoxin
MINSAQEDFFMRPVQRGARNVLNGLDAAANRLYGAAWNPLYQSGNIAVAMLVTLITTGLYLVLVYRIGAPAASVARIAADPWLGSWIRSLHRYASDLFVIAAVVHLIRLFAQSRSWGPRTLAWTSGFLLLGAGLVCAWTGFVMAWDSFGERLAREGARMLDVLPVLSEPVSRIFAGDRPTPSAFFFVNLFMHIGVPLALGVLLWLHVSRVARPTLMPPHRVTWTIVGALTIASIAMPAALGPAADPFTIPAQTPLNFFVAWWLPLTEGLNPVAALAFMSAIAVSILLVPRMTRKPRTGRLAPSVVDPRLCTGCNQCPQDCPWEAITMVKRDDDRPTLVALVDSSRCVSCGICAGSCAPMGVGPPGRTGRDQLALLRESFIPSIGAEKPVVAICCENAASPNPISTRGAHVQTVTCAGNLHSSVVERLLRSGARGVIVFTCPARDCASREGPKWLSERLFNDREAELPARVDRRRVHVAVLARGEIESALQEYDAFAARVGAIPDIDVTSADYEPVCDPVPLESGA